MADSHLEQGPTNPPSRKSGSHFDQGPTGAKSRIKTTARGFGTIPVMSGVEGRVGSKDHLTPVRADVMGPKTAVRGGGSRIGHDRPGRLGKPSGDYMQVHNVTSKKQPVKSFLSK